MGQTAQVPDIWNLTGTFASKLEKYTPHSKFKGSLLRNMFLASYFIISSLIIVVAADSWDDFSNNLAADLAPFLSLFGEQVTKQYLSESVSRLDYLIFSLAPMGILTAVVSVIRVCGSPSLRAFIGRAQEGGGNSEAELCSSTSADVCELFNTNNGGITRVFGRPKILEIMFDPQIQDFEKGETGIYSFLDHANHRRRAKIKQHWVEKGEAVSDPEFGSGSFAPNLSLNLGIQRPPQYVFWLVAVGGFVLQTGVLVFGAVATYYWQWKKNDQPPDSYAFPLTFAGTLLMCCGTYFCASLIGECTKERTFRKIGEGDRKTKTNQKLAPILYWIQPGGQIIGDQTFNAYAYSETISKTPLKEYIISRKKLTSGRNQWNLATWGAVGITVSGFILQFTGLRGIHSAVPVAQLGATLVMSMARAGLRMRRLVPEDNPLGCRLNQVLGHELDWLALELGRQETKHGFRTEEANLLWRFCGMPKQQDRMSLQPPPLQPPNGYKTAGRLLAYRSRLAELTGTRTPGSQADSACFEDKTVEVRQEAQRLVRVIDDTINILFTSKDCYVSEEWKNATTYYWAIEVSFSGIKSQGHGHSAKPEAETLYLKLRGEDEKTWRLELENDLEAILGLWLWSLKSDPVAEQKSSNDSITSIAAGFRTRRIVAASEELFWKISMQHHEPTRSFAEDRLISDPDRHNPGTIWENKPGLTHSTRSATLKPYLGRYNDSKAYTSDKFRFFGWDVARSANMQSSESQNSNSRIWSVSTNTSLLSLCSQEVFSSFLWSILDIVKVGSLDIGLNAQSFPLQNSPFSDIATTFVVNRLGDRRDALLCILSPAVSHLSGQYSAKEEVQLATASAIEHRKQQNWEDAQEGLKRVWDTCKRYQGRERKFLLAELAISMSELYGWALRSLKEEFAKRGIEWLEKQISEPEKIGWSLDRRHAIDRYTNIAIKPADAHNQHANQDERGTILTSLIWSKTTMSDPARRKALIKAATEGWTEIVLALLARGATPELTDYTDPEKRTALYYAAARGRLEIAVELIYRGASLDRFDHDGRTPLWKAAENGHDKIVDLLLQEGANLNARNSKARPPLWKAAENGHHEIVKLLCNRGADPNVKDGWSGTMLHWAAANGHLETVDILLGKGAAPDSEDEDKRSPLWRAAEKGHDNVVRLLHRQGADLNFKNREDQTPLWKAAENGHYKTVDLLLQEGADLDPKDQRYRTPLWKAADNGHYDIVHLLLRMGAAPDAEGEYQWTPLWKAAQHGHDRIVELLLRTGKVDSKKQDQAGRPAIWYPAEHGYLRTTELLLQHGADPTVKFYHNGIEDTILHWIARRGNLNTGKLLLQGARLEPDMPDIRGRRPLSYAAENGHQDIVELLLETRKAEPQACWNPKVDLNARDNSGGTALSWATEKGHHEIAERLQAAIKEDDASAC